MFSLCLSFVFLVLRIKNRLRIACSMLYHVYFLTVFRKTKHSLVISFPSSLQFSPDILGLLFLFFGIIFDILLS